MNNILNIASEYLLKFLGASWRTSIIGWAFVVEGIGGALTTTGQFVRFFIDGDPSTGIDASSVFDAWKTVIAGVAFILTRENKVSTEDVRST